MRRRSTDALQRCISGHAVSDQPAVTAFSPASSASRIAGLHPGDALDRLPDTEVAVAYRGGEGNFHAFQFVALLAVGVDRLCCANASRKRNMSPTWNSV